MRLLPALLVLLTLPSAASAADPRVGLHPAYGSVPAIFVNHATPPVVERGKTSRIVFTGHGLDAAEGVWSSLPAGTLRAIPVESSPGRAVFDLTAAADVPVGVCGLRVATRNGLSNLLLFLVDDLPVRPGATDIPLSLPAAVWGTLREGELDRYRVTVSAGERVSVEVVAGRFGKDSDPLVTIRDAAGKWVAERDNDAGLGYDLRFAHTFAAAGTYTVEVRDARFRGGDGHHYVLRIGRFPAARVAVPAAVEPGFWDAVNLPEADGAETPVVLPRHEPRGPFEANAKRPGDHGSTWVPLTTSPGPVTVAEPFDPARDTGLSQLASPPSLLAHVLGPTRVNPFLPVERSLLAGRLQATPSVVPGALCGVLRGHPDSFRVRLAKGDRLYFRAEAKAMNSPADLEVVVTDRTGRELRRAGEQNEEVNLDFQAPATGDYAVVVRDTLRDGGDAFAYRVLVRSTPFPPRLTAEVEGLSVPQGSYQPVPITVTRTGTSGAIPLLLLGAPPGVKLTPDAIPDGAASVVCKLEADGSAPLGLHTVRIVADAGGEWAPVRTQPLIDRRLVNVDLIPVAPRDDQRRLPPAVADRIAVQVTPPSPFAFELPESVVTLPRYQKAAIPVAVTRSVGFDGPVGFVAVGGQLAEKEEGRTRVYAEFPDATVKSTEASGVVVSKILSNLGKTRVAVTATGTHAGRRVALTRTFELDLTTAFRLMPVEKVTLNPGESTRVAVGIARLKSFDGPVTLRIQTGQGVTLPETVTVPRGAGSVDVPLSVPAEAPAGQRNVQVTATADVDGFEEEVRGSLPVEVRKVEPPKKN